MIAKNGGVFCLLREGEGLKFSSRLCCLQFVKNILAVIPSFLDSPTKFLLSSTGPERKWSKVI